MAQTQTETSRKNGKGATAQAASGARQLGRRDAKVQTKKVDPFQSIPCAVPGKEGDDERGSLSFMAGEVLAGRYVRTKRVYSETFTAGRKDTQGRKFRDLHILRDVASGELFGIWGVGSLNAVLPNLRDGQYIEITYVGVAEKALTKGLNPPHVFEFASDDGIDLDSRSMAEVEEDLPEAQ